jgi:hypothetical protein
MDKSRFERRNGVLVFGIVEPVQPKRIATKEKGPRLFMGQIYGAKGTLPRTIRAACSCGQRATGLEGLGPPINH